MPHPLGYYFYLRGNIDGLLPARIEPRETRPRRQDWASGRSFGRRQSLGLLLLSATICVPVMLAGGIALALRLLS